MLSKNELEELAKSSGLKLHQQEKDYMQMIVLYHIYRKIAKELVFKGGTALEKVYGLNRFSEDLDFTKNGEVDIGEVLERALAGIRNYGIDCRLKKEKPRFEFSEKYKLAAKGPLYEGETSRVFVRIEISGREKPILEADTMNIFPAYRDIPNFSLAAMPLKEIAAEKVRAVFSRDKPRDVYDLWFILNKGAGIDYGMIDAKLQYYGISYSYKEFSENIEASRKAWEKELSLLLPEAPDFEKIKEYIFQKFK